LKREFEEHDCRLKALNDHGDDSPEGELTDGILDQLAKYERAKTAERTRRGKLRKASQGKLIAGRRPNYGFRYNRARDGYEVDENTMPVIERIFRMAAMEGTSVHGKKGCSMPRACRRRADASTGTGVPSTPSSWTTSTGHTPSMRWQSW
jgi:site-specific DNA recombinase